MLPSAFSGEIYRKAVTTSDVTLYDTIAETVEKYGPGMVVQPLES